MINNTATSDFSILTANKAQAPVTINSVLQEIDEWRTKQGETKSPIPEKFWDKIFILSKTHAPSRLRAILGISTTQYNKKLSQRELTSSSSVSTPTPTLSKSELINDVEDNAPPIIEWKNLKEKPALKQAKALPFILSW